MSIAIAIPISCPIAIVITVLVTIPIAISPSTPAPMIAMPVRTAAPTVVLTRSPIASPATVPTGTPTPAYANIRVRSIPIPPVSTRSPIIVHHIDCRPSIVWIIIVIIGINIAVIIETSVRSVKSSNARAVIIVIVVYINCIRHIDIVICLRKIVLWNRFIIINRIGNCIILSWLNYRFRILHYILSIVMMMHLSNSVYFTRNCK